MRIVITGGAGFIGQRLAQQLLAYDNLERLTLADVVAPSAPFDDPRVRVMQANLTHPQAARDLIAPGTTAIFHLAAVVSSQAEANFDLGMAVNVDGTRHLLEAVRHQAPGAMVIFASSLAVYGGELPAVITEATVLKPQSSYGTQKAIGELWINDYSRKEFLDGRVLRLPTVCVRPGKPNAAASSFASSLIREPLKGETAICPVAVSLPLWLSSPNAVVDNLLYCLELPASRFGDTRTVNLPGITVTVEEMIEALVQVSDRKTVELIEYQPDEAIAQIVASWPSRFDISRAKDLGFRGDRSFEAIVRLFIQEQSS